MSNQQAFEVVMCAEAAIQEQTARKAGDNVRAMERVQHGHTEAQPEDSQTDLQAGRSLRR
ncbi:hypothetical protein DIPPA_35406 [Diplonema papillatum]|nr:hypothetical protein DIPPA_35406 [Diplonema papillatum]